MFDDIKIDTDEIIDLKEMINTSIKRIYERFRSEITQYFDITN